MRVLFALTSLLALSLLGWAERAAQQTQSNAPPAAMAASFHHVHLNSTEPARAIDFYTRTFDVT